MTSGLYYSASSAAVPSFLKDYDITTVKSLEQIENALFAEEIDFVVFQSESPADVSQMFFRVFALDSEIPGLFIATKEASGPQPLMQNLYVLEGKDPAKEMAEILSYHRARLLGELQQDYRDGLLWRRENTFITDRSPFGVVLIDAEGSIFYINETARALIQYGPEQKQLLKYLDLKLGGAEFFDQRYSVSGNRQYRHVRTAKGSSYVSLTLQDVFSGKTKVGAICHLQDVTKQHDEESQLRGERKKYESLTTRLNDMLLHDKASDAYNLAYLRRKLDLEINHARKGMLNVRLAVIRAEALQPIEQRDLWLRLTDLLLTEFTEPYVVGVVREGLWLVLEHLTEEGVSANFSALSRQMVGIAEPLGCQISVAVSEIEDLGRFLSSADLLSEVAG